MCALATAAVGGAWLILVPSWPYAPVMAAAAALLALAFMAVGGKKNKTQVSRPLSFTERVEILASKQGLDEEGKYTLIRELRRAEARRQFLGIHQPEFAV